MSTGINIDKSIKVVDETTPITDSASQLTFTGAGVTATGSGGNVTINIPGGSTGTVTNVTGVSPIASSGGNTPAISISDAIADGSTKGAATFTANDFISASGVISLDYANGQKASGSQDGFLSQGDYLTFSGKQNTITGGASTITTSNLSPSFALQSNTSGKVEVSTVTSTELGYVSGVTSSIQTQLNGKQNTLVNPVTGTGASGQVSFWNGTNTQSGSNNFFWDNTNSRLGIGTTTPDSPLNITRPISASGGIGRIINVVSTLNATANSDNLVAVDITPTFSTGAFTGVNTIGLRVSAGTVSFQGGSLTSAGVLTVNNSVTTATRVTIGAGLTSATNGAIYTTSGGTRSLEIVSDGTAGRGMIVFTGTGNIGIGTTTDASFRLDVNGNSRFQFGTTESGINIIGNSGLTTGAIVIGSGTLGTTGSLEIWRNGASALQFFSNLAVLGSAYTRLKQAAGLTITGSGGGTTASDSIILGTNAADAGLLAPISGVQNTVNIGNASNDVWSPSSGTATYNLLRINPRINTTGTYSGTVRGILIQPQLTSTTGVTYRAIETAVGDVIFNSTTTGIGNVSIGGTSFGTSANRVLAVYNGTAPASSPLDSFQMYSADIPSTSTAAPHFRNENGNVIRLYQETAVTTAQGIATALTNLGVLASSTIAPTVQSVASAATVTPTFSNDLVTITAQTVALTLAAPTGTAINGKDLMIRIKDNGTTAQTISWNAIYRAIGVTLPTTTVLGKTTYVGLIYNSDDSRWDAIGVTTEA